MTVWSRSAFAHGWMPDADAVNGPTDGLLRMDNCILDELGVVALRQGSVRINGTPFADLDVHSLFTATISGARKRMAGAGNAVYANGTAIATGLAGAGDIAFGSYLGQILFGRSTSKQKYDGTTVRNWGVTPSAVAPTVTGTAPDSKTFATCNAADAEFTVIEDDGTGVTYNQGQDGSALGSVDLVPAVATHRGALQKAFAGPTDFTVYDAGATGTPNDLVELYFYIDDPAALLGVTLMVDVNASSTSPFQNDYYWHTWSQSEAQTLTPAAQADIPTTLAASTGTAGRRVRGLLPAVGVAVPRDPTSTVRFDKPVGNSGWSKLQVRRDDMTRVGSTNGKDWKTVKTIRVVVETIKPAATRFDSIRIIGNPLSGRYKWCAVSVFNSGQYLGKSAPSPLSVETQLQGQGASVVVTASADGQVNETWLYRMGGVMDAFYRVAVASSNGGTILDVLSDIDAMVLNLKLETDNTVAPDNVIGIAGPYVQRVFALTSDGFLWPSRRINPDSFATGQTLRVTGPDESPLWVRQSLGGLYIGTTRDIYRVEGTGAELPDGTIDFSLQNLNIDHPPINDAAVQDGNLLIYFAEDGWRAVSGAGSTSLTGATSLLYRGQTRHGRGPVATATGRFRAAISKGQLVTLFPEGAETTRTARLGRHVPARGVWYYHEYPQAFRCVYRDPDGTLIASDAAGTVWQLDTGTDDGGTAIPVTLWTPVDANAQPYQRKDPWDIRMRLDGGGATVAIAVHQDGSASAAQTVTTTQSGEGLASGDLSTLAPCYQFQLRVTGACTTFRLYDFGLAYRERPILSYYVEEKPVTPSATRRRFSGLNVILDTLAGAATVTPVLDNVLQTPVTVTTPTPEGRSLTFPAVVGRDLWARIVKATGFELYQVTPRILEELPPVVRGLLPRSSAGDSGVKTMSGIRLRACTVAATRTITVYLDGVALAQRFAVTTGADDPDDVTLAFTTAQTAREVALSIDGDLELYSWSPIISARQPLGVTAWDSGPIDLGDRELVWVRRFDLKVRAGAPLFITTYMDGAAIATVTCAPAPGTDTVVAVDLPRGTKGRQPRLVVTSAAPFFPYWIRVYERVTGTTRDKTQRTIPVTLGGGA